MTVPATDPLASARQQLGRRLAAARGRAGFTQVELARRLTYSRSSVANAETGRALPERTFWRYADRVLPTDGTLVTAYDAYRQLALDHARRRSGEQAPGPPVAVPATPGARPVAPPAAGAVRPAAGTGVAPAPGSGAAAAGGGRVPSGAGWEGPGEGGAAELVWGGYLRPTPHGGDRPSPDRPADAGRPVLTAAGGQPT